MKDNNKIGIVNLSNYVAPEIKEYAGQSYVTYGKKNSYFDYLIDRSRGSATNGAIIKSIVSLIFGEGLNDETFYETLPEEDIIRAINDLKSTGQFALQVQYFGGRKSCKASHLPIQTLAPEKVDSEGNINAYYYAQDWSKVQSVKDTVRYPAFGTSKEGIEILYIKPYNAGLFYFSTPDYQGALQYAELEEEIANYHVNNIKSGLAPSMIINLNNGVPESEQERKEIEYRIEKKYTGSSNAGRVILMFNDNKESEATITPVPLSDASEQYQFLSDECMKKLITGHRVTSPLLLGISTATGFSSNADELKTASVLFESLVIEPFRQTLIRAFEELDAFNGKTRELEFVSLNPFMDDEEVEPIVDVEEEETPDQAPENLSKHTCLSEFDNDFANALIIMGEDEDLENWELIDESEVDYELEEYLDKQINDLNNPKLSILKKIWNFVSTGTARPNAKSEQDGENVEGTKYKVRYQYAPLNVSDNSRDFCRKMVSAAKVYRKEDIIRMENMTVNKGWGLNGADTYSIWLYKGGGGCHHKWFRKTYVQRGDIKVDVNNPLAETISTTKARQEGFRPEANDSRVSIAPVNMPNKGFVNK